MYKKYGEIRLSDELYKRYILGEDEEYNAEQNKRYDEEYFQSLVDSHACPTCSHFSFPCCIYWAVKEKDGPMVRIKDPEHHTCQNYSRDYSVKHYFRF